MNLKDKVAVVTGCAGGLGASYVQAIAAAGGRAVGIDIDGEGAERVAAAVRGRGHTCSVLRADLTDEGSVRSAVEQIRKQHGRIDILINNAGGALPGGANEIDKTDLDHWTRVIHINLTSTMLMCKAVVPGLKEQRSGKIVNTSSRAARSTGWFGGVSAAYVAAKAGVISLTRQLARDLGPHGINVNCIAPGLVITGPSLQRLWDNMTDAERERMLNATPLRRLPDVQEITNVVMFLVSDMASYITGASIDVNGGSFMS